MQVILDNEALNAIFRIKAQNGDVMGALACADQQVAQNEYWQRAINIDSLIDDIVNSLPKAVKNPYLPKSGCRNWILQKFYLELVERKLDNKAVEFCKKILLR